jgi:hypothetical protein
MPGIYYGDGDCDVIIMHKIMIMTTTMIKNTIYPVQTQLCVWTGHIVFLITQNTTRMNCVKIDDDEEEKAGEEDEISKENRRILRDWYGDTVGHESA